MYPMCPPKPSCSLKIILKQFVGTVPACERLALTSIVTVGWVQVGGDRRASWRGGGSWREALGPRACPTEHWGRMAAGGADVSLHKPGCAGAREGLDARHSQAARDWAGVAARWVFTR